MSVSVPPRVVARESEVSVRAGASAELECVAHGNPPPQIHWRKIDANNDHHDKVRELDPQSYKHSITVAKTFFKRP